MYPEWSHRCSSCERAVGILLFCALYIFAAFSADGNTISMDLVLVAARPRSVLSLYLHRPSDAMASVQDNQWQWTPNVATFFSTGEGLSSDSRSKLDTPAVAPFDSSACTSDESDDKPSHSE